jgi:hypothetical protein
MLRQVTPATNTGYTNGQLKGPHLPSVATQQMHELYESINYRKDAVDKITNITLADGQVFETDRAEVVAMAERLGLAMASP